MHLGILSSRSDQDQDRLTLSSNCNVTAPQSDSFVRVFPCSVFNPLSKLGLGPSSLFPRRSFSFSVTLIHPRPLTATVSVKGEVWLFSEFCLLLFVRFFASQPWLVGCRPCKAVLVRGPPSANCLLVCLSSTGCI